MSFFDPYLTQVDKMKILKLYCASPRHTQWDPRVSFLKSLKCSRSSSDKLFFLSDGRTERGNNNIPDLSLESAGIIIRNTQNKGCQCEKDKFFRTRIIFFYEKRYRKIGKMYSK